MHTSLDTKAIWLYVQNNHKRYDWLIAYASSYDEPAANET